jgi:hypothetical protein
MLTRDLIIRKLQASTKIIDSDPPELGRPCGSMLIVLAFGVILSQFL